MAFLGKTSHNGMHAEKNDEGLGLHHPEFQRDVVDMHMLTLLWELLPEVLQKAGDICWQGSWVVSVVDVVMNIPEVHGTLVMQAPAHHALWCRHSSLVCPCNAPRLA